MQREKAYREEMEYRKMREMEKDSYIKIRPSDFKGFDAIDLGTEAPKKKNNMEKFYKVMKDTVLLNAGAIIKKEGKGYSYQVASDLWNTDAVKEGSNIDLNEYAVEHAPEWYERVYEVIDGGRKFYVSKGEAIARANADLAPKA